MPAVFQENEVKSGLKDKRKLSTYIEQLVMQHRKNTKQVKLGYVFCTDAYLLQLNKQFLDHDTYTDILTFDISDQNAPNKLIGEIYISVERVQENAKLFGAIYSDELLRVIFHGALHLCGYKDKTEAEEQKMRVLEDACIAGYKNQNDK